MMTLIVVHLMVLCVHASKVELLDMNVRHFTDGGLKFLMHDMIHIFHDSSGFQMHTAFGCPDKV